MFRVLPYVQVATTAWCLHSAAATVVTSLLAAVLNVILSAPTFRGHLLHLGPLPTARRAISSSTSTPWGKGYPARAAELTSSLEL